MFYLNQQAIRPFQVKLYIQKAPSTFLLIDAFDEKGWIGLPDKP